MQKSEHTSQPTGAVAEVQGLYGAFSFPERLLQKIWQRGEFDLTNARLADGRPVRVLYPGKWNHLGGPDFSAARLVIDGGEIVADVEMHLHGRDWVTHGHATDPAYDRVGLHVVLFPGADKTTDGAGGRPIPILCLLPLLHRGLEEYAAEDAMERLAGRPLHEAQEALGMLGDGALTGLLREHADKRWRAKVHFARERIRRLGWEGACHHAALEILGYRFNRAPMLSVAAAWPPGEWSGGRVDADAVFASFGGRWSLHGVRPLNHPRLRLRQYAGWCVSVADWPARLRAHDWPDACRDGAMTVADWRRRAGLACFRTRLRSGVCADAVGGSRFDNLVTDGFLPLIAAETGRDLQTVWSSWPAGDAPDSVVKVLTGLGMFAGRDRPVSQGPIQGMLGWLLERDSAVRG